MTQLGTIFIVVLAQILVGFGIVVGNPAIVVAVIVVILTVPVVINKWPLSTISLSLASTALDRYRYDIEGWGLKIEYVVVLCVSIVWIIKVMTGKSRIRIRLAERILAAWLFINLLSSVFFAPNMWQSLKYMILLCFMTLIYLALSHMIDDSGTLDGTLNLFLGIGVLVAIYGIAARWLYPFGINLGVQIDPVTGDLIPYGTLWEGNIFGSFTMSVSLVFLTLCATSGLLGKHRALLLGGFVATFFGMILSLSRGAYVGFVAGGMVIFLVMRKDPLRLWILAIAIVGFLMLISSGIMEIVGSQSPVIERFSNLLNLSQTISWQSRFSLYSRALDHWQINPLLGWGSGSFGQVFNYDTEALPAWIGNLEIHILHDTGMVGLGVFVSFIAVVVGDAVSVAAKAVNDPRRNVLIGLLAGFLGLLVAFQATEATWLGFTWVYIALLVATTRIIQEKHISRLH